MDILRMNQFIDAIEKLAFEMKPPNSFTPRLVSMCIQARRELNDEGTRIVPPLLYVPVTGERNG